MSYRIVLAGQDITAKVDEPTIQVVSNLGQGAGVMSHTSGRATTAQFEAYMGPLAQAPGAGQFTPPFPRNGLTPNQSNVETNGTDFQTTGGGTVTRTQDATVAWQGSNSLKVVCDGTQAYQGGRVPAAWSALQPATLYTFSAYVLAPAGQVMEVAAQLTVSPYTAYGSNTFTATGAWQRVSMTVTTPTPLPSGSFGLQVMTTTATPTTFWMDGMQLELGTVLNPWVVGGTEGYGSTLVRQGELVVYDANNNRIFGGYMTNMDDRTKKTTVKTACKGVDYWTHLDRVTVTKTYDGVSDTYAIKDLLTTYAPQINQATANLSISNITLFKQVFRGQTLQAVLQHIADITGFDMWVDAYNNFHYEPPSQDGNAPFAISDSPDNLSSFPCLITQHGLDDNSTINRVTFVGGSHPTTDFTQDVSTQANGTNTTFVLAYSPHESSDGKIHVTVGGVQQVVGFVLTTDQLKSQGGACDVLVDRSKGTLTFNTAPAAGAVVQCLYRYQTPLVVVVTNQQSFTTFGTWFDGVITDQTVFDTTTALQRCRTLLAEQAMGLEKLSFTCWQPGLQAGMRVQVVNQVRGINTTFRVQSVTTTWLGGGQFRYDVQAGAWDWKLADILMAAARFSQQADQNFDEVNVSLVAVELVSNMGVHDAWTTKTRLGGYYFARSTPEGDGHDAYPGLFTVGNALGAVAAQEGRAGVGGGMGGRANVTATGHVQ